MSDKKDTEKMITMKMPAKAHAVLRVIRAHEQKMVSDEKLTNGDALVRFIERLAPEMIERAEQALMYKAKMEDAIGEDTDD